MTDTPQLSGLTETFGKDLSSEAVLASVNALLAPIEASLRAAADDAPRRPMVFVLGPPRSGSTLTSQLLAASQGFATISNVAARFWQAPALGLRIERALTLPAEPPRFASSRGATSGFSEPHEFGYFWSSWFDLGQDTHTLSAELRDRIDAAGLARALAAMEAEVDRPLAFKNNTWFSAQADWIAQRFPTSVFVACERGPLFIAQSLFEQRLTLFGAPDRWWSVRPSTYPELIGLPPLEQVARQALDLARETEASLARTPPERIVRAPYEQLCENPRGLLERIATACEATGGARPNFALDAIPSSFQSTNRLRLDAETARELERVLAKLTAER